ncbi:hypothetical protein FRB98_002282 [Tulasnella sp. 332]|nr:hypothetical protein FRB98_002282 [Tulasnella sp. 332]
MPQASEKAKRNAAIDEYRTYMAEPKNVSELAKWAHDHPAMISEVEKAARRRVSEKGEDTGAEEDDDEEAPDAHLRIITMEDRYSAMEELSGLILSLAFDQVRNYNLRLDINGLIELFVDRFKTNVEKGVLAVTATGKLRGYLESCHRLPTKEAADMLRYSQGQIAQQSMNQTAETLNNRCDMVSGSGAQIPYPPTAAADDPTPVRHTAPVRITKHRSGNTRKGRSGTEIPVIEPLSESRDDQMAFNWSTGLVPHLMARAIILEGMARVHATGRTTYARRSSAKYFMLTQISGFLLSAVRLLGRMNDFVFAVLAIGQKALLRMASNR